MRIAVALVCLEFLVGSPLRAVTLSEGQSAYSQNQIAQAERIFTALAADPSALPPDRAAAARELARIAWLIDGNAARALDYLTVAANAGDKPCETGSLTVRVLRQSGRAAEAISRSAALLAACPDGIGDDEIIRTHVLGARLDLAAAAGGANRAKLLTEASIDARSFGPEADIEAARLRMETGLLTGDAPAALAAWKDYFWIEEGDAPQALANAGVTAVFTNGLARNAPLDDRLKLTDLLMRTGFAVQSRRFADAHGLQAAARDNPVMKRLQAYWSVHDQVEATFLKVNRRMARGGKTPAVLKAAASALDPLIEAAAATLMKAADSTGEVKAVLKSAYGLVGTGRGETSGYPSLHMGHLIEDREMLIAQHGKTAKIHYMSVDNMLANGFESWLWDGGPMVGGWQADGVIVQVRGAYVKSPLRAFRQSQDSPERRELIANERRLAPEDKAKLRARPVATLPGLGDRLQIQLVDRIMAVARTRTRDERGLRKAFLAEFSRANFNQSIEVHEGRHAIDESLGLSGKAEQPVFEYQAKLSELVLAEYPRMALRNMNLNLEGNGPHDKAGARIFSEYAKWIAAHSTEVMGFDPALPALVQLDKLTDGQIREIARNLDPLPNGRPSPLKLGNEAK